MKTIATTFIFLMIIILSIKSQNRFIWIRIVPNNFNNQSYYKDCPYKIDFQKDSIVNIKYLKIRIDTISTSEYIKFNNINNKCQDCSETKLRCLMFSTNDFKGIENYKIKGFNLLNPWGFSQYEYVEGECLNNTMFEIFSIYLKPTNSVSIVEFDDIEICDLSLKKNYKLITQLKIK